METTPQRRGHAVVLGASMSGLLAASAAADHHDHVTIIDRDELTGEPTPRRGVPQGWHAHVLLPRGARAIDELHPGILDELVADGVPAGANLRLFRLSFNGHPLFHEDSESRSGTDVVYGVSRPCLESHVLRRTRALSNVTVMSGHDVVELLPGATNDTVAGVRVADRATSEQATIDADLVIAATGRGGGVGSWLTALGYDVPPEERVEVDVRYSTRMATLPSEPLGDIQFFLTGPVPEHPAGMGAVKLEDGRWIVTLAGFHGHHPPTDETGWMDFARGVCPPELLAALAEGDLGEIHTHRFPANLRRRYDRLRRFPHGLVVVGDAVSSFNPVYGQGMTVAALEALALQDALRRGGDVAARHRREAAARVATAWEFAVGSDLGMPVSCVPGKRPLRVRASTAYVNAFQAAAERDQELAWRFLRVTGFDEPMWRLFSPDSLGRIARSRIRRQQRVPAAPAATPS